MSSVFKSSHNSVLPIFTLLDLRPHTASISLGFGFGFGAEAESLWVPGQYRFIYTDVSEAENMNGQRFTQEWHTTDCLIVAEAPAYVI